MVHVLLLLVKHASVVLVGRVGRPDLGVAGDVHHRVLLRLVNTTAATGGRVVVRARLQCVSIAMDTGGIRPVGRQRGIVVHELLLLAEFDATNEASSASNVTPHRI